MADTKSTQEHGTSMGNNPTSTQSGTQTGTQGSSPGTTTGRTSTTAGQSGYSAGTTGSATQRVPSQMGGTGYTAGQSSGQEQMGGQEQPIMDQARQAVNDVYERTTRSINGTYHQAMEYGRENPGTMTLIAFGAGVAVGLLIAGSFTSSRSRTSRIVPPIMNALSEIAEEFLR